MISPVTVATVTVFATISTLCYLHQRQKKRTTDDNDNGGPIRNGYVELIGATPMIEIKSLSKLTGCRILAKCEYLNPGGSSKDRIARNMVVEAEKRGELSPGGTIVEGTSGSTGISLAQVARAKGYRCVIVMPDDQAQEKRDMLTALGAELVLVKPAAIVHREHYVNTARRIASEGPNRLFVDQFENPDNCRAHFKWTGPEIHSQAPNLDAFVMSAGTGGTISGVGLYLKAVKPSVKVVLADPPGSSLYHRIRSGVVYTAEQAERKVRRHRYDTITEGIGIDRMTHNLRVGCSTIDDAIRVSDAEATSMAHHLLQNDGLFVGSSSAVNCFAAVRVALQLGPGHTVVTALCGSGVRERTKIHNPEFLKAQEGLWPVRALEDHFAQLA